MMLSVQQIRLSRVAKACVAWGEPRGVIGTCFALYSQRVEDEARKCGVAWHVWLLRLAIVSLWAQSSKKEAYVCYVRHNGVIRLFVCSRLLQSAPGFFKTIHKTPVFMERGRDPFPPALVRPLAYWEPPQNAIALWPTGLRGQTEGARVVDTGAMIGYSSYPESDHDRGVPVDEAGPEYVRVPQQEPAEFEWRGKTYRYLNRWAAVQMDL